MLLLETKSVCFKTLLMLCLTTESVADQLLVVARAENLNLLLLHSRVKVAVSVKTCLESVLIILAVRLSLLGQTLRCINAVFQKQWHLNFSNHLLWNVWLKWTKVTTSKVQSVWLKENNQSFGISWMKSSKTTRFC